MSEAIRHEVVGVTLGWNGKPSLLFDDGKILFCREAELALYPEYFSSGEWPTDPITQEKLPMLKNKP